MRIKPVLALSFIILSLLVLLFVMPGCNSEPVINNDLVEEEPVVEPPETPSTYYWPWMSHGHLDLSTGEVIPGPDLFESELGFIAEFTEDHSYEGQLVWLVEESDVFALEWVNLSFNVDYFEDNERVADLAFEFEITNLQPEPNDDGIQEFSVELVEQQQGFEVVVNKILLGKEQEGTYSIGPIDYVALEVEMRVVGNP